METFTKRVVKSPLNKHQVIINHRYCNTEKAVQTDKLSNKSNYNVRDPHSVTNHTSRPITIDFNACCALKFLLLKKTVNDVNPADPFFQPAFPFEFCSINSRDFHASRKSGVPFKNIISSFFYSHRPPTNFRERIEVGRQRSIVDH